jgi:hypothetical protein
MAKRTRIIEGTWNCSSCGRREIPARLRACPACNNPREETDKESEFDFGGVDAATGKSLRESVTDEKALSAAGAGADWFCEYCGASNRGDNPKCRHCRAERSDASRTLHQDAEPPEPLDGPPPPPVAPPKRSRRTWMYVVLGLIASCGTLALWGARTRSVTGQVTDTAWTHTVHRETFERVQREGWRNELVASAARMPVNGQGESPGVENIRFCATRQRGTRQVADGTERVCSTKQRQVQCGTQEKCSRQNMGNGFQKEVCHDEPKYCSESYEDCQDRTRYRTEPVFDTSCTYDTFEWKEVDRKTVSGHEEPPTWPQLTAGPLDRLRREEQYSVSVAYDSGKTHEFKPNSETDFLHWRKGQSVPLKVSNFGGVQLAEGTKP